MTEKEIIGALAKGKPFDGLPGVRVTSVREVPSIGPAIEDGRTVPNRWRLSAFPDVTLELQFGENKVTVYAEVKNSCTPKLAEQIAPWLASLKQARKDAAVALICPVLSPETQAIFDENDVDFIDLAGNVSVNVPGRFLLRRTGLKGKGTRPSSYRDPFSGSASRVVRVFLQKPREWTMSGIAQELASESRQRPFGIETFAVSPSSISKTLRALEEELLVRRRGLKVLVPEPRRLLIRWAEKYKERYRGYLRQSFKVTNRFGIDLKALTDDLRNAFMGFVLTGAAAASVVAPFVDIETIEVYLSDPSTRYAGKDFDDSKRLLQSAFSVGGPPPDVGPECRVVRPYDAGVFMYSKLQDEIPVVSDIQLFLDLYARGGRDLKQAEYLLAKVIGPRWEHL